DPVFGNLRTHQVDRTDQNSAIIQSDAEANTFYGVDMNNWLTGVLQQKQLTSSTSAQSMTRTLKFTPDPQLNATTGLLSGETKFLEIEPSGDLSLHLMRTFERDTRGRPQSISEADYPSVAECNTQCNGQCNASCQSGCAGSANPGACI